MKHLGVFMGAIFLMVIASTGCKKSEEASEKLGKKVTEGYESMKEEAKEATQAAKDKAEDPYDRTKEKAADTYKELKGEATEAVEGTKEKAEAMEEEVLRADNVKGISEVRADGVTAPAPVQKVEYYEIQSGDTLPAIAKRYYGKVSEYPRIFEANREVIRDPNLIYPGQKIRIPME